MTIKTNDDGIKYCDVCHNKHSFPNLDKNGNCKYCNKEETFESKLREYYEKQPDNCIDINYIIQLHDQAISNMKEANNEVWCTLKLELQEKDKEIAELKMLFNESQNYVSDKDKLIAELKKENEILKNNCERFMK